MRDFLFFRKMVSPYFIQIFFWIGCVLSVVSCIHALWMGLGFLRALAILIIGPMALRLTAEWVILLFRMYDSLTHIETLLSRKDTPKSYLD